MVAGGRWLGRQNQHIDSLFNPYHISGSCGIGKQLTAPKAVADVAACACVRSRVVVFRGGRSFSRLVWDNRT